MQDTSSSGAAFLVDAESVWTPGDIVDFAPFPDTSWQVVQRQPQLPMSGRVLRVEDADGPTRRIAVRIERAVPSEPRPVPKTCDDTAARLSVLPGQSFAPFASDPATQRIPLR